MSAKSDADILACITRRAEKNAAAGRTEIESYCREVCKIEVTGGWVDSFISRPSAELIKTKSSPQEDPRLQVPRGFRDQTIRNMYEAVQGRPADLVLNSILMKSGYPTGRIDNGRRWWLREPPLSIRFIINHLGA
jgi:hypothetical protein